MKIVYIGTPELSASVLEGLLDAQNEDSFTISHVITQEDQPVGRKKILTPSPVKQLAVSRGIPVHYSLELLRQEKFDLAILFAFGKIIPKWALKSPIHGFWNIHPSRLPFYRGASPLVYPILLGENETAVTLMQMDEALDHGPILEQVPIQLDSSITRLDLETQCISITNQLLVENLQKLNQTGNLSITEQNHCQATFTRPLDRNDGYISKEFLRWACMGEILDASLLPELYQDWYRRNPSQNPSATYLSSTVVYAMYRALIGWPGIWTTIVLGSTEKRLKLLEVDLENERLILKKVQLEGKNPVDYPIFARAYGEI